MPRDRDHFRVRLIDSHAGFQATHHCGCPIIRAKLQFSPRGRWELIIKRRPQFLGNRKFEIRRHDADHGCRFAINPNTLSDDVRVGAEIAAPNVVPENGHFFRARLVVLGREIAAHYR